MRVRDMICIWHNIMIPFISAYIYYLITYYISKFQVQNRKKRKSRKMYVCHVIQFKNKCVY